MTIYHIVLAGALSAEELNAGSPHLLTPVPGCQPDLTAATCFTAVTDQSGLIGLLRHLHGLGYSLIALTRQPETPATAERNLS